MAMKIKSYRTTLRAGPEIQNMLDCLTATLGTSSSENTIWELVRLYVITYRNELPPGFDTVLNSVTTADNFEDVADRYGLDILEEFNYTCISEQVGIEVWGRSSDGKYLVYDNNDGWYYLPERSWIKEVQGLLETAHGFDFNGKTPSLDEIIVALKECDTEQPHNEF